MAGRFRAETLRGKRAPLPSANPPQLVRIALLCIIIGYPAAQPEVMYSLPCRLPQAVSEKRVNICTTSEGP
jgi:hypothetical protein